MVSVHVCMIMWMLICSNTYFVDQAPIVRLTPGKVKPEGHLGTWQLWNAEGIYETGFAYKFDPAVPWCETMKMTDVSIQSICTAQVGAYPWQHDRRLVRGGAVAPPARREYQPIPWNFYTSIIDS
jgi:hypothetical protein